MNPPERRQEVFSQRASWYTVAVLTSAYLFSFIDRQILSLMVGPIQRDLGLSDTQFSLLHGLAFALFYTLLGIPIARLADTRSRRRLIAAGVALWSVATAMGGLARNFTQLFAARIAVGVGEAALSPAAYSMLADIFPRHRLGRAISVYSSGVFFGIGLSFIIGGVLVASLEAAGGLHVPLLGTLKSWQATFMIVGIPGLLISLLALTLTEPKRVLTGAGDKEDISISAVLAWVRRHRRLYLTHFIGFSMLALMYNAIMAWAPEYFIRIHGLERAAAGTQLGLIAVFFGGSGIICGGLFTDRLTRRGELAAPILAGMLGVGLLLPFAIAAPLVTSPKLAMALFCPLLFFVSFPFGPAASALQMVSPPRMRAQISAVYLFFVNLLGIGFGGTATALVTDFVFRDSMKLHWSMAAIAGVAGMVSVLLLWSCIAPFRLGHAEQMGDDA